MRVILLLCAALAVSACASASPDGSGSQRLARLTEECTQRGGVLRMSDRSNGYSGEYVCGGAPVRQLPYDQFRREAR